MTIRWLWLAFFLLLISIQQRSETLFLLSILLALLIGASNLWARWGLVAVTYRRQLSKTRLYLGEDAELRIEMVNAKPLPLPWLRVDDSIPKELPVTTLRNTPVETEPEKQESGKRENGKQESRKQENGKRENNEQANTQSSFSVNRRRLVNMLSMRWYERVVRRYRVQGVRRGEWHFGPASLRTSDLFGFHLQSSSDETIDKLIVFPRIVPITQLGLPARHPFGLFRSAQRLIDDPMRVMGTRDYTPGDNVRYIHWKASARSMTLQTKVFDPSAQRPVLVVLNINTAELLLQGLDGALREYAICAAASITRYLWEEGAAIGLACNSLAPNSFRYVQIKPRNHSDQLFEILTALARIQPGWAQWPLTRILALEAARLPYGATIVVITATINRALEETLLTVARRGFAVAVVGLGEGRLSRPLPQITYFHIGSHKEWDELETLDQGKLELDR